MSRVAVEYRTAGKSTYEKFCAAHPDVKISFKDWKKVIEVHNHLFRDYILDTGEKVKMYYGFGPFAINKKKIKRFKDFNDPDGNPYINLRIDWKKTKEAGKRIYHTNPHTSGYQYSWYWQNTQARFHLSDIWNFKIARVPSRLLAELLLKPNSLHAQIYKSWKRT